VIDCSPEGHQPEIATRIFQGVQQPVCIVLAARALNKSVDIPARVRFHELPTGRREVKFAALASLSLEGVAWADCPSGWRDPFLPKSGGEWAGYPTLDDLFVYNGSGVMPGRTWVIAPDSESLRKRWSVLIGERNSEKRELLFYPHQNGDKTLGKKSNQGISGHEHREIAVGDDQGPSIAPTRYGFRSFDRQWIIPDNRLINRPNPTLWNSYSPRQFYLMALEDPAPSSGPAITFSSLVPDLNFYKGSAGGRVYPAWRNAAATEANVKPSLLTYLAKIYGELVKVEDVMAYVAAIMAHPAFTSRFALDLVRPGLRIPITADAKLFAEAVSVGSEVIWLHCYGERFADPAANRPKRGPRLPKDTAPKVPIDGAIPSAPKPLPDSLEYDPAAKRLKIGSGYVDNVTPAMWAYEVSGKQVLWQWFSYRRRDRTRPVIGDRRPPSPLDSIQPDGWLAEYTTDLLDLLNVIGRLVALEPVQADLLNRICEGPLRSEDELATSGAFATPELASPKPKGKSKS